MGKRYTRKPQLPYGSAVGRDVDGRLGGFGRKPMVPDRGYKLERYYGSAMGYLADCRSCGADARPVVSFDFRGLPRPDAGAVVDDAGFRFEWPYPGAMGANGDRRPGWLATHAVGSDAGRRPSRADPCAVGLWIDER